MNGIYPAYVGPTEQYRLASLYPRWTGGFLLKAVGGATAAPFKRYAVTPEVMAEIKADWQTFFPTVVVPAEPALRPTYQKIPSAAPERYDGYVSGPDNVVELTRKVAIALPQFNQIVFGETETPILGVSLEATAAQQRVMGETDLPSASAVAATVGAPAMAYRTVLLPDTINNPSDEELVAIALKLL